MSPEPLHGEPTKKKSKSPILLIALIGACVLSVPCIGILSAIAIPSFIGYVRKSKVAEAESNLTLLGSQVEVHCQTAGTLPGRAGPVPAYPMAEKQVASFGADPVFAALGFAPLDPVFFSYSIEPSAYGGTIELVAAGDLDGDGTQSRFTRTCYASCTCDPTVRTNEIE